MPLLRTCSSALATALAAGPIPEQADLFKITLAGAIHTYRFTSYDTPLTIVDGTYLPYAPFVRRSRWNVVNTMQVPELSVTLAIQPTYTPNILTQAIQGLFDGAAFDLSRVFMPTPGDTVTYGTIDIFFGDVGQVQVIGNEIQMRVKGKTNRLNVMAPRNTYQAGCLHTFCDTGCTLSRGTFTATYAVGTSPAPTGTFIPWASAPGTPLLYGLGSVTFLTGANAGLVRSVVSADSTGLTLAYPLPVVPSTGDTFSAFQGCDKTTGLDASGTPVTATRGGNCNFYTNVVNFRGFPFVPPPETMATGSGFSG